MASSQQRYYQERLISCDKVTSLKRSASTWDARKYMGGVLRAQLEEPEATLRKYSHGKLTKVGKEKWGA